MDVNQEHNHNFATVNATIEEAKKRCESVIDTLETLHLNNSCKHTLLRLIQSELSFLSRFSSTDFTQSEPSICVNVGHLEAVVHILRQPYISGVSRVCKTIQNELHDNTLKGAHVDIVCTFEGNPVWFIVSDRNPKYISWYAHPESSRNKGLQAKIRHLLKVAHNSISLKPTSIIFFFSNGLDKFTLEKFHSEFEPIDLKSKFLNFDINFSKELEGEWINITTKSYQHASILKIKINHVQNANPLIVANPSKNSNNVNFGGSFGSLLSHMSSPNNNEKDGNNLVNFDTTALIAIVSGISSGNTQKLLDTPKDELIIRFKGNTEFVINQVMSEIENPIHAYLSNILFGKKCVICESVLSEFKELVAMCGGPNEKSRADYLLKYLVVVKDNPSGRMMSLPTTRKLALKNKVVFGTGDYWRAPTLTANMGFVRAVSQTGMSLFTYEHSPRALTGD